MIAALVLSIKKLEEQFRAVVHETKKDCKCADLSKFKDDILLIPSTLRKDHRRFIRKRFSDISRAENVDEIFRHLNFYWTYLDYSLLEYIVHKFGSEHSKQMITEFIQDLERFMATTTMADFKHVYTKLDIPPGFKKMITRHKWDPCKIMLLTVKNFLNEFCKHYRMHKFLMMFERSQKGSIAIVWQISSSVVKYLRDDIKNSQISYEFLKLYELMEIMIDGEVVFSVVSTKDDDEDKVGCNDVLDISSDTVILQSEKEESGFSAYTSSGKILTTLIRLM